MDTAVHYAATPTPLRELTFHVGSHSVNCPAPHRGDIPAFTTAKLVLDLAITEGYKAELTQLACYTPR